MQEEQVDQSIDPPPDALEAEEADEPIPDDAPDEITLSNSVRFKLQAVPPILVRQAAQVERPKPPKYSTNGHEEENVWSPAYQEAVKYAEADSSYRAVMILITRGIKAVIDIPDGMPKPDDDSWVTDLTDDDIEVDVSTPKKRLRSWINFVALESNEDIAAVQVAVARLGGAQDAEVDAAVATFRNRAKRRANRGSTG